MPKKKTAADVVPVINESGAITGAVESKKAPKLAPGEVAPDVSPTLADTGDHIVRHKSCEQETTVPRSQDKEEKVYCGYCRDRFPRSVFETVTDDVHASK